LLQVLIEQIKSDLEVHYCQKFIPLQYSWVDQY
jgi:hypothetical protein